MQYKGGETGRGRYAAEVEPDAVADDLCMAWRKAIEELNNATVPCMGSNKAIVPLAFVASSMKSAPFPVPSRAAIKWCHSSNDQTSTKIGLPS
jgi:hypothetical protein